MADDQRGLGGTPRREILRLGGLVGAGLALSPVLAGCSGTASAPSGKKLTPKRGGTLRVGAAGGSQTDTLDAHLPITQLDNLRVSSLYDQLTLVDNNFKFGNLLAESVEPNSKADEWTIRVHKDIEFHNGKTLDADDVIFSLRRILDPKLLTFGSAQLGPIDAKNIKKIDKRTVRVSMTKPYSTFNIALGDGALCGVVPVGYDPKHPVGTGPFKFVGFTPGERSEFARFENYWGAKPYLDRVIISDISDDAARVNAILSGQVDVITQVPFAQVSQLTGESGCRILESKSGGFQPLVFRCDRGPFADVRLRQAIRLLVDREQAVKVALSGHGFVANDIYSPFDPHFDRSLVRKRDIAQATALIKQAGYAGKTVQLITSPLAAGLVEFCSVLVQNAKKANLNIEAKQVDPATLFGANNNQYDFAVTIWPAATFLTTASVADIPSNNGAHYHDPEYRALFDKAEATLDPASRATIETQMQMHLFDKGPYLIPYFANTIDAYRDDIGGWPSQDLTGIGLGRAAFAKVFIGS